MNLRALVLGAALFFLAAPAFARSAESRFVVAVGANYGTGSDEPLRYAETDARRFFDLMLDLGSVAPDNAFLLLGKSHEELLRVLSVVQRRAAELRRAGRTPTLVFYFAGHGDRESLHLPGELLKLSALRRTLSSIPSALRLSILDACRIGGQLRAVQRGPTFGLRLGPDGPRGTVELQASSDGEAAQESEELGGAIFTHFLLSGLRGGADLDNDGRVTLGELYAYAYRRTLLRSASALVVQHPELVAQISSAGEVVLTEPRRSAAFIELPTGAERYLVFSMPGAFVVGEVSGSSAARLAVPPTRLLVVSRSGNTARVAEVDLSWGGTQRLASEDFKQVASQELALRSRSHAPSWQVAGMLGAEGGPPEGVGPAYSALVRTAYTRDWELGFALGVAGWGSIETTARSPTELWIRSGTTRALLSALTLGKPWRLGRMTIVAAAGLEARWTFQSLEPTYGWPAEDRSFGAGGGRLETRAAWALERHWHLAVGTSLSALFRGAEAEFYPVFSAQAGLAYAL